MVTSVLTLCNYSVLTTILVVLSNILLIHMYIVSASNTFSSVFYVSSLQEGVQALDAVTDYHNLVLQCYGWR
jgi:hypothetical protein